MTGIMDTASFEIFRPACSTHFKNLPASEGKCVICTSEENKRKAVVQQTYKELRVRDRSQKSSGHNPDAQRIWGCNCPDEKCIGHLATFIPDDRNKVEMARVKPTELLSVYMSCRGLRII